MESTTPPFSEIFDLELTTVEMENVTVNVTNSQKAQLLLYDILIPTVGALAIILNGAVVFSSGLILKKGQQPRSTYLLLGNVAMTDLVTSIAVMFGQMFPNQYRDHSICSIQIGMIVSSTLASVFSVGLIAIDRFLYIIHGMKYQQWVFPLRVRILILITWMIGCVLGFLPLMGWSGDSKNGKMCWFVLLAPKELIFLTVCLGMVPLITVVILYSIILYHAIRKIRQLSRATTADAENKVQVDDKGLRIFRGRGNASDTSDVEQDQPSTSKEEKSLFRKVFPKKPSANPVNNPSKWKAINVVVLTTGSFIITWCPYFVVSVMYTVCGDDEEYCKFLMVLLASPLAILGFCNGLINPIIYAWWHRGFRTFVTAKMQSFRNKRKSVSSSKNTSSTSGNNRKISNISSDAAKLATLHQRSQSKEKIFSSSDNVESDEKGSDNKSFTKSEASTKQSNISLNRNSRSTDRSVSGTPDGFSYMEESRMSDVNLNTHL